MVGNIYPSQLLEDKFATENVTVMLIAPVFLSFGASEPDVFNNFKGHDPRYDQHASACGILYVSRFRSGKSINSANTGDDKHLDKPKLYNSAELDDTNYVSSRRS